MQELKFLRPTLEIKDKAELFKQEFFDNNEFIINGSSLFDKMEYSPWLKLVKLNEQGLNPDWVTADTFFVERNTDKKIIGISDIRHSLDNRFLAEYGGYIGYAVLPSERKKGYATKILKMSIDYIKQFNIEKIMLGTFADNIASVKTIEKCKGFLFEEKFLNEKLVKIYHIAVK